MRIRALATALVIAACAAGPALADKDHNRGHGKHGGWERHDRDVRFGESDRVVVREYYVTVIRGGHCPPGLAKKHNGCLPPGQAKKRWAVGRPLPREVIFYDLPPPLIVELGPPPPGYRYARVANDVLLLAIGTGMVIDAISDLGRM